MAAPATSALMAPFVAAINARRREGCTDGARLYAEVQAQGHPGSRRTVQRYLAVLRRQAPLRQPEPTATPRAVAALIVRRPEQLDVTEQAELDRLSAACPELATTHRLAQGFAALVRARPGEAASRAWLAEAISSGIPGVVSFAAGLRHDEAAVVAGLTSPWSSGALVSTLVSAGEEFRTPVRILNSGSRRSRARVPKQGLEP